MGSMKKNIERIILLLLLITIVACSWLKPLDEKAEIQVDQGLKRALVSFAVARLLNGLISVVQETEISLSLGVGVNLTPGQILDPINDLVEQFSELMLIASVAFGIMKVLLSIGSFWVFSMILSVVVFVWAVYKTTGRVPPLLLTKLLFVLIFVRFSVPLTAVANDLVYNQFLKQKFNDSQLAIEGTQKELATLKPMVVTALTIVTPVTSVQDKGLLDKAWDYAKNAVSSVGDKIDQVKQKIDPMPYIEKLKTLSSQLVDHIINLIVVFVLQAIVIPFVFMWALYRSCLALVDSAKRTHDKMAILRAADIP